MNYTEADYKEMVKNPEFMAGRWKQRLAVNEKEYEQKRGSLTPEERVRKQEQLKAQYKRMKHYEKLATKER